MSVERTRTDATPPTDDPAPATSGAGEERTVGPRWVALASSVAAALTLAVTRITHAGVGTDAIAYIAIADSIREGDGARFFLEDPLVTWPPLWPAILAAGMWVTGWRGDVVAVLVNSLAVAGCVACGWAIGRRVLTTGRLRVLLLVALGISPVLVGLAAFVQTEVVFAMLSLAVLASILRAIEDSAPRWLVVAGLLTAVGFYVRYQAVYIVPALTAWLALQSWLGDRSLGRAMRQAAYYALPAVLPSAVWIVRNLSVSDTALGPRFASDLGPGHNLAAALVTMFKFLTGVPVAPLAPTALLAVVLGVVSLWWLERVTRVDDDRSLALRAVDALVGPIGLLTTFVAGLTALMVVSRSVVGFDDLDIRLLAPCFVPVALLLFRYVEITLVERGRRRIGHAVMGVWLAVQVLLTVLLLGPSNHVIADFGYNADRAVAASRSPALDAVPADCVPYSNNAGDLYRSGFEAQLSPRTVEYKSSERTRMLEDLTRRIEDGEAACLVWVEYSGDDEEFYSPEQIAQVLRLELLASADEVTVYRLHPLG